MKTFTHIMDMDSVKVSMVCSTGAILMRSALGVPNEKKAACTTSTRNMAHKRKSSKLACLIITFADNLSVNKCHCFFYK